MEKNTEPSRESAGTAGRLEAVAMDEALRELERTERQQLLMDLQHRQDGPEETDELEALPLSPDASLLRRLQRERHQLVMFHNAVWQSRPWQLIQIVRGFLGRAWPAEIYIDVDPTLTGLARLQQEVERLAGFRSAVLRSNGWRIVEFLRTPLGRRW